MAEQRNPSEQPATFVGSTSNRRGSDNMWERLIAGAAAGAVGTAAMTVFMKPGLARWLPPAWRPDEFVPRQVVQWAEGVGGDPDVLTDRQEALAAAFAHLGYGVAMGALYGMT